MGIYSALPFMQPGRAEQLTPWHWGQPSLGEDWELVEKFFFPLLRYNS